MPQLIPFLMFQGQAQQAIDFYLAAIPNSSVESLKHVDGAAADKVMHAELVLAHAANWSRSHAAILKATHGIGGDPGQLQVYGWAAWSPRGWIVTLRNPSDKPQSFPLNLESALQVPQGAKVGTLASDPFGKPGTASVRLDPHHSDIRLAPFEVRTFESTSGDSESR